MTLPQTALAVLLLLLTPGPTNTLLAIAGAERGWIRAVRLIPAELTGYLIIVVPLSALGGSTLLRSPETRVALTLIAAAWIAWLALRLWRTAPVKQVVTATAWRVGVTTLLNPKALVFGLVLLPASTAGRVGANIAMFAALVIIVAMLWAALGSSLRTGGAETFGLSTRWGRTAALWLAALAAYLVGRVALA